MNQGNLLPQIQDLQSQQNSIRSAIVALESNLNLIKGRLDRYQEVFKAGGVTRNQIEELEQQKNNLSQQIQGEKYQLESKASQIDAVKQNLQQDFSQKQAEESQSIAAVESARQQVEQAKANVQIKQKVVDKRAKEFNRVQNRTKDLELRADKAGTVVTPDLDKKQNQYLQAGSPILEIVDLTQLMLIVQIKNEDKSLVYKGQTVTFRPQGRGLLSYTGTVKDINQTVSSDAAQHPPTITVYVSLNQSDNSLHPGFPGHAHIEVKSSLLYQKLQREFEKLVPIGKFF